MTTNKYLKKASTSIASVPLISGLAAAYGSESDSIGTLYKTILRETLRQRMPGNVSELKNVSSNETFVQYIQNYGLGNVSEVSKHSGYQALGFLPQNASATNAHLVQPIDLNQTLNETLNETAKNETLSEIIKGNATELYNGTKESLVTAYNNASQNLSEIKHNASLNLTEAYHNATQNATEAYRALNESINTSNLTHELNETVKNASLNATPVLREYIPQASESGGDLTRPLAAIGMAVLVVGGIAYVKKDDIKKWYEGRKLKKEAKELEQKYKSLMDDKGTVDKHIQELETGLPDYRELLATLGTNIEGTDKLEALERLSEAGIKPEGWDQKKMADVSNIRKYQEIEDRYSSGGLVYPGLDADRNIVEVPLNAAVATFIEEVNNDRSKALSEVSKLIDAGAKEELLQEHLNRAYLKREAAEDASEEAKKIEKINKDASGKA